MWGMSVGIYTYQSLHVAVRGQLCIVWSLRHLYLKVLEI